MTGNSTSQHLVGRSLRLALLSASCLIATPALAQSAAPADAAPAADEPQAGLEQITVTARKRVENVQDVPIAVSAITGESLENRYVPDVRAVAKYIPNVQLGQVQFSGATLSASIRGLTFADIERSFEPAVATSIDGVFLASNTGALVDLFDVGSIEVLRGPQGTLFGRNTIGGIIKVERTRPTGELGAKLSATVGSYGRHDFKAVLNAPIVKDVLALKVGVFSINSHSFTYNYASGKADPGLDRLGFTGTLLFTPTDKFEALFTYEHLRDRSHYPQLVNQSLPGSVACDIDPNNAAGFHLCFNAPLPGAAANSPTLQQLYEQSGYRASFTDVPFSVPLDANNYTLNMKYKGENFNITSVTGLWSNKDALDIDNIGHAIAPDTALFHPVRRLHGKQFSQELRLDTEFDGLFNIVAGLYYFDASYELDIQNVYLAGGVANPGLLVDTFSAGQKVKSYAAFAETYWKLGESTRLTLGGRYTHETKDFHVVKPEPFTTPGYQCPDPTSTYAPCANPHLAFNRFTPRVSLDQKFGDNVMVYASWARGFRSGGWNGRPGSLPQTIGPYQPESVDSYELGLRSKFDDNRALFNLTVFQTDYNNKQEDSITSNPLNPVSTITAVVNASKARFRGVEAEAQYKPNADLHFFASAGYLWGKYLSFPGLGPDGSDADNLPDVIDLRPIKNLRYAPKWNFSLGGEYTIPVGSGDNHFVLGANVKYLDKYATEANKDTDGPIYIGYAREIIPAHTSVDASLSYFGEFEGASKYKISAFVNDAFHGGGRIVRSSQAGPFWFSDRIPNRTWGVEVQLDF